MSKMKYPNLTVMVGFDILKTDCEAIVNPVNCVGISAKGLALQFKQTFPDNFAAYKAACEDGKVRPGAIFPFQVSAGQIIINFPTKRHWRMKSKLPDIINGMYALTSWLRTQPVKSIAIPPLGCGQTGRLDWTVVKPTIKTILKYDMLNGLKVKLYEPFPSQPTLKDCSLASNSPSSSAV